MKKIVSALFMALFCLVSGVMSAQTDKVVRILSIGNSFSEDAVEQHLHDIAAADGQDVIIGNMYIGGCSLKKHLDNARGNKPAYKYRKIGLDGKKVAHILVGHGFHSQQMRLWFPFFIFGILSQRDRRFTIRLAGETRHNLESLKQ